MSIEVKDYFFLSIDSIVARARRMDGRDTFRFGDVGSCGMCQGIVWYSAISEGVPLDCVKVCRVQEIFQKSGHGFNLLILDKVYLVDLSFSQFLCNWETDQHHPLVQQCLESIIELRDRGYTEASEPLLLVFFLLSRRTCGGRNEHEPLDQLELSFVKNTPFGEHPVVNLFLVTLYFPWKHRVPDYTPTEALENGWISKQEKAAIEKLMADNGITEDDFLF